MERCRLPSLVFRETSIHHLTVNSGVNQWLDGVEHVVLGGFGAKHAVESKIVRLLKLVFPPLAPTARGADAAPAASPARIHNGKVFLVHAQYAGARHVLAPRQSAAFLLLGPEADDHSYRFSTCATARLSHTSHAATIVGRPDWLLTLRKSSSEGLPSPVLRTS